MPEQGERESHEVLNDERLTQFKKEVERLAKNQDALSSKHIEPTHFVRHPDKTYYETSYDAPWGTTIASFYPDGMPTDFPGTEKPVYFLDVKKNITGPYYERRVRVSLILSEKEGDDKKITISAGFGSSQPLDTPTFGVLLEEDLVQLGSLRPLYEFGADFKKKENGVTSEVFDKQVLPTLKAITPQQAATSATKP